MLNKLLIILILGLTASMANAACTYNGKTYSQGTVIGPYVCKGSKWVRK